ncbi:hypothetical protein ABZP36_027687 [Zizania latifolia]
MTDLGMKLSELGEPDEYFNALKVGVGSQWVASEGGHGSHPGFAKWTVQPAPGLRRSLQEETHIFYSDEAQVHFTGKMLDGTVFPSTREDGVPLTFIIGQVNYNVCLEDGVSVCKSEGVEFNLEEGLLCPAFARAVETMTEGELALFIVKPEYGFGERGWPSIGNGAAVPPDATLYLYLQLMSWKTIMKKTLRRANLRGKRAENPVHPCGLSELRSKSEDIEEPVAIPKSQRLSKLRLEAKGVKELVAVPKGLSELRSEPEDVKEPVAVPEGLSEWDWGSKPEDTDKYAGIFERESADQRSRLLRATERQNQTADRIRDSHRTMLETEDLGVSILHDLQQQRQSLLHAHDTLHSVDDNVGKSRKIIGEGRIALLGYPRSEEGSCWVLAFFFSSYLFLGLEEPFPVVMGGNLSI